MKVKKKIENVIGILNNAILLKNQEVTVGFDGFVDSVVRVIRSVDDKNSHTYFQSISEFGEYIIEKKDKSCSIELEELVVKIGGNMPILANALGNLGAKVNCIGAMGFPEIHNAFRDISSNCVLYSIARPGYCTALEFRDGKVMLGNNNGINSMTWQGIKELIGLERLIHLYSNSRIVGLFNWSEINPSTSIWEGIINDILPKHKPNKGQIIFFDLSDCSKRDQSYILYALKLIEKFNEHFSVILSLNENETGCIFNALNTENKSDDPEYMGEIIYDFLNIDTLIVHPVRFSFAWDRKGKYRVDNLYIAQPKLSTGGGDNFNAGFCLAKLIGADMASSLIIANAVSGFYIKNGYSANKNELIEFLHQWQKIANSEEMSKQE